MSQSISSIRDESKSDYQPSPKSSSSISSSASRAGDRAVDQAAGAVNEAAANVEDAANRASSSARSTARDARAAIESGVDSIHNVASNAASNISHRAHDISSAVHDRVNAASDRVGHYIGDPLEQAFDTVSSSIDNITSSLGSVFNGTGESFNELPDDPFWHHTRSLEDKYDSALSNTPYVHIPTNFKPAAVASAIATATSLAPTIIFDHQRAVVGEILGYPDNHSVQTAYYSNTTLPDDQALSNAVYHRARVSGELPHLRSNIVSDDRNRGRIHPRQESTNFTCNNFSQREVNKSRAAGHIPRLDSYYHRHHNAVPRSNTHEAVSAVNVTVKGPDGRVVKISPEPLNERQIRDVKRGLTIAHNRFAGDLTNAPTSAQYIDSIVDNASESFKRSLAYEEKERLKQVEQASSDIIKNQRQSINNQRSRLESELKQANNRERDLANQFNRERSDIENRIEAGKKEWSRLKAEMVNATKSEIDAIEKKCSQIQQEISQARNEAKAAVERYELATQQPRIIADTSSISEIKAATESKLHNQLQILKSEESRLLSEASRLKALEEKEREAFKLKEQEIKRELGGWREKIRRDTQNAISKLDSEVSQVRRQEEAQRAQHNQEVSKLQDIIKNIEKTKNDNISRHNALQSELNSLERERQQLLQSAASNRDQALQAKNAAIARVEAKSQALAREAAEELNRVRSSVQEELNSVRQWSEEAVVKAAELQLCVEEELRRVSNVHLQRGNIHVGVAVDDLAPRQITVPSYYTGDRVTTTTTTTNTNTNINTNTNTDNNNQGFFSRLFNWSTAAASVLGTSDVKDFRLFNTINNVTVTQVDHDLHMNHGYYSDFTDSDGEVCQHEGYHAGSITDDDSDY